MQQCEKYFDFYINFKDITKNEEKLNHKSAILNDIQLLESYQMQQEVDSIVKMMPLFKPDMFIDDEVFIGALLRNASSHTIQTMIYGLKSSQYVLIDRYFILFIYVNFNIG